MPYRYTIDETYKCRMLRIERGYDADSVKEILKGDYESLWLGWADYNNLNELLPNDSVRPRYMRLLGKSKQDVSWINSISSLKLLLVDAPIKGNLNFDNFPELSYLSIDYDKASASVLSTNAPLETLSLTRFTGSLELFGQSLSKRLKILGLNGGNLQNLDGISGFTSLESLVLNRLTKLTSIKDLSNLNGLERLEIAATNNIDCLGSLSSLKQLKRLTFENKELPSLTLLPKSNLEVISLGGSTTVLDKKIEELLKFPKLKRVFFRNRKGYKYTAIEINRLLGVDL